MTRYKLIIEYDGTQFHGFQRQKDAFSVQELIEKALYKMTRENVLVIGSGRTDAGVHAKGQVVHFDLIKFFSAPKIQEALNHFLKTKGACVIDAFITHDNFHARFDATLRHYEYVILNRRAPGILDKNRAWYVSYPLDIDLMEQGAQFFLGHHDFKAFRCVHCQSHTTFKTIKYCTIRKVGDLIYVNIASKSFLHNQVRIMVGSLVEIGKTKHPPFWIKGLLENGTRIASGQTAPAHGLYFMNVDYNRT